MNVNRRRQVGRELREELFDAVHDLDDVRAGLALDVEDDRGRFVHPCRKRGVFDCVGHVGHVGKNHRRAVGGVGDDQGGVILAGEQLVVGIDFVGLLGAVEVAQGLVDAGLLERRAQ